jgi:hypothetical protein
MANGNTSDPKDGSLMINILTVIYCHYDLGTCKFHLSKKLQLNLHSAECRRDSRGDFQWSCFKLPQLEAHFFSMNSGFRSHSPARAHCSHSSISPFSDGQKLPHSYTGRCGACGGCRICSFQITLSDPSDSCPRW